MPASPNNNNCLSLHDLQMYHEGKLDRIANHAVEDHLLSCELCSSALEGFAIIPFTLSDVPDIPVGSAPAGNTTNWAAMIGVPFVACFLLVSLFDQFRSGHSEDPVVMNDPSLEMILADQDLETEKRLTSLFEKTEELNALITKDNEVKELVNKMVTGNNDLQNFGKTDASLWMMPQKGIDTIATIIDGINLTPEVEGFNIMQLSKDTFIHDLRVTSYRELYYLDMAKYDMYLKSTDAKYETKTLKEGDNSASELVVITSADILDKALDNFSKNNFTDALKLFNLLIKHEPNDVNALFYAAVCYINLSRASDAMIYLEKIHVMENSSFDQETRWQMANALVQLKEFKRAASQLEAIVSAKGFYTERAKDLLKRVKARIK